MSRAEHSAAAAPRVVSIERGTEPFSGLPTLWVGGLLPDVAPAPAARVEVLFDGVLKTWMPLRPLEPAGSGVNLQVLEEPGLQTVRVVLRHPESVEKLIDIRLADVPRRGDAGVVLPVAEQFPELPSRLGHLARRVARKVRSGEVLDPRRWAPWTKRVARKVLRRPASPPPTAPSPAPASAAPANDPDGLRRAPRPAYDAYVENNALTPRLRAVYEEQCRAFRRRPKVSILMPVYNVEVRYLAAAVESVRGQIYPNWELCLADDASTRPELITYLKNLAGEPRIKVVFRGRNGHICAASNSAAELATGEFVAFMDNDDALAPDALFHYVRLLQDHPDADIVYSDEDKIDAGGRRYDPQLKPDWSPEMFLSYNYVNHFTCMRRALFERAGRFREGYEGGQDYDLLLRATELTDRVHHVPRVLYHWRSLPSSTASAAAVKPVMFTSVERGLRDALARRGIPATTYTPAFAERLRLPIHLLDFADSGPSVAILVPATDDAPPDAARLAALRERTAYANVRLVLLDRTSDGSPAHQMMQELAAGSLVVIRDPAAPPSALVNRAAAELADEFLLLFDPALEPDGPQWLSRLVGYARLPGVGCAGPRVVDDQGRIQHAGVVLNLFDETAPGRGFQGELADAVSYYFQAEVARPVAAVAGECLLVRRQTLLDAGGLDAERFPAALAAVELCRRLAGRGLRSVYVAGAELRRRGPAPERDDPRAVLALLQNYGRERDPYYNPNLSQRFSYQVETGCPQRPALPARRQVPVLFAAHNLNAAEGAPRYLFDIAAGLSRRGRVRASVFSPLPGPGAALYRGAGIDVHVGHLPHAGQFLEAKWEPHAYASTLDFAAGLLTALRPEVVVANTLCNFPLVEAAARAGIPSVWIIHESYTAAQMRALHSPYALCRCLAAFTLADRVLIASHDTARLFAPYDCRNAIEVIHNGLEAAAIEEYIAAVTPAEAARAVPGPAGRKRITAIGTVCERKGQHTLVEAAALLRRRGRTDFCVYLVGVRDTSLCYVNYIRALIDREGLHGFVELVPETNDVRPYLRATDVFVCASHVEAFSRSVLEAEAFGLPVVTTPCCGANEQVVWGHNAFRFDFSDSRQLADHLERLLADDELRRRMGQCSRAVYECHLTNEDMLERYERLILNVWLHAPVAEAAAPVLARAA